MELLPGNYAVSIGRDGVYFDRITAETDEMVALRLKAAAEQNRLQQLVDKLRGDLEWATIAYSSERQAYNNLRATLKTVEEGAERLHDDVDRLTAERDTARDETAMYTVRLDQLRKDLEESKGRHRATQSLLDSERHRTALLRSDLETARARASRLDKRLTEIKTVVRGADDHPQPPDNPFEPKRVPGYCDCGHPEHHGKCQNVLCSCKALA